jgi:mRNA interferase MazF
MKRGEVWWASLPGAYGRRPVVLLTRDAAYGVRTSVSVAPVTRTIRDIPVEVRLGPEDGLSKECVVNLDGIITIPIKRLERNLSTLSAEKMELVGQAIKYALALR